MRILPSCPKCNERDLWTQGRHNQLIISCRECGWRVEIQLPQTVDGLSAAIAAAVEQRQAAESIDNKGESR